MKISIQNVSKNFSAFAALKNVNLDINSGELIALLGPSGSGKTTLAFQLKEKLNLHLYHLDQYYWLPNWQRREFEKFKEMHTQLCEEDAWIMEGAYVSVLRERVLHADVVIFLDTPRYVCIWRVLKRAMVNHGKVLPGSPAYCREQILSFKFLHFLKWVWTFNKRYRHMILDILDEFKTEKQIHIFKSPQEITDFIKHAQQG
jgi:adenylate kinase family enzyme